MKVADIRAGEAYAYAYRAGDRRMRVVADGPAGPRDGYVPVIFEAGGRLRVKAHTLRSVWVDDPLDVAWSEVAERFRAIGYGAEFNAERDRLRVTFTDPSQARRVLAALESAAAGEETT